MITNFHTHTQRCLHAFGSERDYVETAVKQGVAILGFSDHGPFPDKDYGLRMKYEELPEYISKIDKLKEEFKNTIKLHKGLEIEYHPQYADYYKMLLNETGLDYLILGEHMYTLPDGQMKNIFFAEKTTDFIDYARAIEEALVTGSFATLAHPDIMFINELAWDTNCTKACDIILSAAEKYDIPLEFNANGIRRGKSDFPDGKRYPYPHERFWSELKGSKQKVIIGSDSHVPEQIYDESFRTSEQICSELNLNVIKTLFQEEQ